MIHTAQKFEQELRKSIVGIKTTLRKAAYKGMEAAIKRVVEDSKVWSGSFILSNRLGIGAENTAPPTNIKQYAAKTFMAPSEDGGEIEMQTPTEGVAPVAGGYKYIPGYPLKMGMNLEEETRGRALNGLLGKLVSNKKAIDPFGKLYLTNDVTDPKTGDYALVADEYSNNVYTQAFRMAEIKAQGVFDKAKKIDKVTDL